MKDSIYDSAKTPKKKSFIDDGDGTDTKEDIEALWAGCDRGILAQQRLTGVSCSYSVAQTSHDRITQLVPIKQFANELHEWDRNKLSTLIELTGTYFKMRHEIVKMLTGATGVHGQACRDLIDTAKQAMFNGDMIHDIAIYCIMIYIWATHADSDKQELVRNAIDDVVSTVPETRPEFKPRFKPRSRGPGFKPRFKPRVV